MFDGPSDGAANRVFGGDTPSVPGARHLFAKDGALAAAPSAALLSSPMVRHVLSEVGKRTKRIPAFEDALRRLAGRYFCAMRVIVPVVGPV